MKAYKYRIYPNAQQAECLRQHFGRVRFVYNWALAEKNRTYQETGKGLSKREVQDRFVHQLKKEKTWLTEVNSQSLLAALGHLHTAFVNFFAGRAKFPNFKRKSAGWQSFQCPQHVRVDFDQGVIHLPKIPGIKAKFHRRFDLKTSKIKTVTIKRSPAGHYFASVLVATNEIMPTPSVIEPDKTLGIDLGLTHLFWGMFLTFLGYKCIDAGKNLLKIGRFEPSSKRCNSCGHKMDQLLLSVRVWDCPSCGTQGICRDTNAARNIRDLGLAEALGKRLCVKCSHTRIPVSAGLVSKGTELLAQYGSQEAPHQNRLKRLGGGYFTTLV